MRHHDQALARYLARTTDRADVLGVLVTGSVARGTERPDSDVDLVTVVTDHAWQEALLAHRTMVVETEGADYDGGYFDVKLATLEQLRAAAERGDGPVRASLGDARVAYDQGFDLEPTLDAIAAGGLVDTRSAAASYIAQARLHGGYFLEQGVARADPFLAAHAAVHLALAGGRAVLVLAGVHHPGPKDLVETVAAVPEHGRAVADAMRAVAAGPTPEHGRALLELVERLAGDLLPDDATLSRFVLDNELAWFRNTVPPEHW